MRYRKSAVLLLAALLSVPLMLAACGKAPDARPAPPPAVDTPSGAPDDGGSQTPPLVPPDTPEGDPEPEPEPLPAADTLVESLASGLTVRSGPGTGYSAVGTMGRGDMVDYIGMVDGWYVTVYREKRAYVSASASYTRLAAFIKAGDKVEAVIEVGKTLLGIPYVLGAQRVHWGNGVMNPNFTGRSYDCSSFVQYAFFKGAGVLLDTTTRSQSVQGKYVAKSDIKRGDVLFFTNDSRVHNTGIERIGHVAIYLGNNYILHTASDYAVIEPISAKRWSYFITARDMLA